MILYVKGQSTRVVEARIERYDPDPAPVTLQDGTVIRSPGRTMIQLYCGWCDHMMTLILVPHFNTSRYCQRCGAENRYDIAPKDRSSSKAYGVLLLLQL